MAESTAFVDLDVKQFVRCDFWVIATLNHMKKWLTECKGENQFSNIWVKNFPRSRSNKQRPSSGKRWGRGGEGVHEIMESIGGDMR